MKLRLAAAALCLAAPSGLAAQEINISLDETLVKNFDGTDFEDAMKPFNATVVKNVGKDGVSSYAITFPGGLSASAEPVGCRDEAAHTGCGGLRLTAYFKLPDGKTVADIPEIVNGFNDNHVASQAAYDKQGTSRLTSYVISDFGITRTNLVIHIYTFRQTASAFHAVLFPQPTVAAPAPAKGN